MKKNGLKVEWTEKVSRKSATSGKNESRALIFSVRYFYGTYRQV